MRIFFIRHGATVGNQERRYVGTTDEPLTEEAERGLSALRGRYPTPDCVFASPLRRCLQTAQILFPELQPEEVADLRECSFGDFEYKNYQELQEDVRYQAWIDSGGILAFPGGESREEFSARCCAAFEKCCRQAMAGGCGSAAFVVHGGTIMAVLDRYARPHRDYFDWQTANAKGYACELTIDTGEGAENFFIRVVSTLPLEEELPGRISEEQPLAGGIWEIGRCKDPEEQPLVKKEYGKAGKCRKLEE